MSQLNKNKRLVDATFEDFEEFLDSYLQKKDLQQKEPEQQQKIRGLNKIADVLKISVRTLSRLRKETHIFDDVINQKGKIITADINELKNIKINENQFKKH